MLTTAHRNHDPENCADDELFAACQSCHLAYDREHHAKTRAETLEKKRAAARERIREQAAQMQFGIECATGRPFAR